MVVGDQIGGRQDTRNSSWWLPWLPGDIAVADRCGGGVVPPSASHPDRVNDDGLALGDAQCVGEPASGHFGNSGSIASAASTSACTYATSRIVPFHASCRRIVQQDQPGQRCLVVVMIDQVCRSGAPRHPARDHGASLRQADGADLDQDGCTRRPRRRRRKSSGRRVEDSVGAPGEVTHCGKV